MSAKASSTPYSSRIARFIARRPAPLVRMRVISISKRKIVVIALGSALTPGYPLVLILGEGSFGSVVARLTANQLDRPTPDRPSPNPGRREGDEGHALYPIGRPESRQVSVPPSTLNRRVLPAAAAYSQARAL